MPCRRSPSVRGSASRSPSAPIPATTSSTCSARARAPGSSRSGRSPSASAARDTALVRRFGDVARREYRAVGLHMALSPQADLATEPRWSRAAGTFGEDAALAGALVRAYVEGFQHGARGKDTRGVLTIVKHWVGYGASKQGLDGHNYYGRFASSPAGDLDYHVRPFLGAFAARVAGVMPTYDILEGATLEREADRAGGRRLQPAAAHRAAARPLRFDGVILTDWLITNDCSQRCREGAPAGERPSFDDLGMPWGVENAIEARALREGRAFRRRPVRRCGGGSMLVDAVRAGELTEARLDSSAHRAAQVRAGAVREPVRRRRAAATVWCSAEFRAAGSTRSGARSCCSRRARDPAARAGGEEVFLHRCRRTSTPLRLQRRDSRRRPISRSCAWTRRSSSCTRSGCSARCSRGRPGLPRRRRGVGEVKRVSARVPTIVTVYLDRPAILTALRARARPDRDFGVSDAALLDVLTGTAVSHRPPAVRAPVVHGAVEAQRSDVPHDSERPLYPIGFGRARVSSRPPHGFGPVALPAHDRWSSSRVQARQRARSVQCA